MSTSTQAPVASTGSRIEGKFLSFTLSNEKYGLDILKIQEIIGVMHITRVPKSPSYLKGVINLRGKIIPVIDLRLKFGLPQAEYDERTCVIVVDLKLGGRPISIGVVVDTVLEVSNFQSTDIEPAPDYGTSVDTNFIMGMARCQDKSVIILIDIERALADASVAAVSAAATPTTAVDSK